MREEVHSAALYSALGAWPRRATSEFSRVELTRAVRRAGGEPSRARQLVSGLSLIAMTESVLDSAETLEPRQLRSLDALQLATAVSLGDALGIFIAYDERLLGAAEAAGLAVLTPR